MSDTRADQILYKTQMLMVVTAITIGVLVALIYLGSTANAWQPSWIMLAAIGISSINLPIIGFLNLRLIRHELSKEAEATK